MIGLMSLYGFTVDEHDLVLLLLQFVVDRGDVFARTVEIEFGGLLVVEQRVYTDPCGDTAGCLTRFHCMSVAFLRQSIFPLGILHGRCLLTWAPADSRMEEWLL